MKYRSQKVAYWYFRAAMALFCIQVLGGLRAGWISATSWSLKKPLATSGTGSRATLARA